MGGTVLPLDNVSIVSVSGAHNALDGRAPFSGRCNAAYVPGGEKSHDESIAAGQMLTAIAAMAACQERPANLILYSHVQGSPSLPFSLARYAVPAATWCSLSFSLFQMNEP